MSEIDIFEKIRHNLDMSEKFRQNLDKFKTPHKLEKFRTRGPRFTEGRFPRVDIDVPDGHGPDPRLGLDLEPRLAAATGHVSLQSGPARLQLDLRVLPPTA